MEQNIVKGYIYKITNIKNEMSYIGKTTYANIQKRFNQHKYYALTIKGGKLNSLHQAIRDFGINNFTIEIIDTIYEPNSLEQKEKEYIALYHTYVNDPLCKGYNQSKGGEGTHYNDENFSEELADKIITTYEKVQNQNEVARQLQINVKTVHNYLKLNDIKIIDAGTIAIKNTGKKVAILKENEIIAIYPSLGEAARHFIDKESASHISEVCYGKRPHVKGYTAQFTDENTFNENYFIPTIHVINKNKRKQYQMIDINTNEVINTFESGCDAGRYFQMDRPASASTCIARAIQRNGTWRGYKWKQVT